VSKPAWIAIAQRKGGAGKTTTAISLSAEAASRGRDVVLVDLDPSGDASRWLGIAGDQARDKAILDAYVSGSSVLEAIVPTRWPHLSAIPSPLRLAKLAAATEDPAPASLIRRALGGLDGLVIIDCPPGMDLLASCALVAASHVVIPVAAHHQEVAGVFDTERLLSRVEGAWPESRQWRVLIVRTDQRTRHSAEVESRVRTLWPERTFASTIREAVVCSRAAAAREPLVHHAPHDAVTGDYAAMWTNELQPWLAHS
jgi:chromosome partitioning protein